MNFRNLNILCCPACREKYHIQSTLFSKDVVEEGYLTCPRCCITVPVMHGFPLFQEQSLDERPDLEAMKERIFGKPEDYLTFLEAKQRKPAWDLYAAFQPFNESTQALFPLIHFLRELMQPGDLILDLWCRTGWSGELLAANFPDQQIISVWESYAGVLGAKGFHYWLSSSKRRKNLDIIFHSPNDPLPFGDQTFVIVHGLDTLHRYRHVPLISECRRVVKPKGAIFFPHCHLTNSEPDPYFDRGEDQLHGKEYEEYFGRLFSGSDWKGYVLSEKKLFDAAEIYILEDEPDTSHYNAAILLTDQRHEGTAIPRCRKTMQAYANAYAILNPLYDIDLSGRLVKVAPDAMDRGADELFYRHPIYHHRLLLNSPIHLSEEECLILYWAEKLLTVSEIAARLALDASTVLELLLDLEKKEVVQLQNISRGMAALQSFYSAQRAPRFANESSLTALWMRAQLLYEQKTFLIWPEDDSHFTYGDCDKIVRMAAAFLKEHGVGPGDRVILTSEFHPEFLFLFWAIVLLGAVAVPVNEELTPEAWEAILNKTQPKLVLISPSSRRVSATTMIRTIVFACNDDSPFYSGSFSESLVQYEPVESFPDAFEHQEAVILFTSGSTGAPKGVVLSHGSLFRSAEIMDREYRWLGNDIFLGVAGLHTMSGLRNPCLASLQSGSSVVLPSKEQARNPMAIMNLCMEYGATILNVGPAFLSYWNVASQKAAYFAGHHIRMVLCTGSALHPVHRDAFEKQFACPVYDYYGLTETSGICILINGDLTDTNEKGIGRPVGSVVKIVDEDGQFLPPGSVGELAIYSENLMTGYLGDPILTGKRIRKGWFYTGDSAQFNENGCVVLFGRRDRMLIDKNGENFYPDEIERAINQIPGVIESFVTKYTDAKLVDSIAALVAIDANQNFDKDKEESRIRDGLLKDIPAHHIPSLFLIVNEIPKGSSGKVSPQIVQQRILEAIRTRSSEAEGGLTGGSREIIPTN